MSSLVGNNLFLGFWTSSSIHGFRQGDYMAVYAGLGLAQAFFSFLTSFAFACVRLFLHLRRLLMLTIRSLASLMASLSLFKTALAHVLRSPSSFFDTTPMGRLHCSLFWPRLKLFFRQNPIEIG
jgi:hypothetical protein